ncbi:hypothetical protein [Salinicoccus bachuensis]|uniref:Lipoprotein n=1 Tax=Salinicoccus bachuensis TaxID=3136731 RepID=A0ABZ3CIM6_9STAP
MRIRDILIGIVVVVLAGCGSATNTMKTAEVSENEKQLISALSEETFVYEVEHADLEKPYLNIWIEEYVYGEKQEEYLMRHSTERTDETGSGSDEGRLYFSLQDQNNDRKSIKIIHMDNGVYSISELDAVFGEEVDMENMSRTSSTEIGESVDFSDEAEVVIGVMQYFDNASEVRGVVPEALNKGNVRAEDLFEENPVSYLIKVQFSSEPHS